MIHSLTASDIYCTDLREFLIHVHVHVNHPIRNTHTVRFKLFNIHSKFNTLVSM